MLGYISATRKKSCHGCVRAKRRCDLGYPFCKRCFVKGLDCKYPNAAKATVRDAEVIIRFNLPEATGADASSDSHELHGPEVGIAADANIDPQFLQSGSSRDSRDSSPTTWHNDHSWSRELAALRTRPTPSRPSRTLLPEVWAPSIMSSGQIVSVIQSLCAFVPDIAFSGSTHFLHPNLYQTHQPQAYQDCVALSALYLTKNTHNQSILANSINAKIAALVAASRGWSLTEHLAAVQALTLYQIIRLFDPDLQLQYQAEKHNHLLEVWSALLWKRFFNEAPPFTDAYSTWVFKGSLRRTVMMSVFVRCGWGLLTKDGLATEVPVLARLPITRDLGAWTCEAEDWNMRRPSFIMEDEGLMSYGDFSKEWSDDRAVEGLDPFARLLLAACQGAADPRLL